MITSLAAEAGSESPRLDEAGVHSAAALESPWLVFNGWNIGATVLALAGLFRFSALKYRCLEACRTPAG
jgi:predicted metal-binding membrane protein